MPQQAYICVAESLDSEDLVELPLEADSSVLLSTVQAQFPGCYGLKYKPPDSKAYRGLRAGDGKLYLPDDPEDWKSTFVTVFPKNLPVDDSRKDGGKRKAGVEEQEYSKMSRMGEKPMDLIVLGVAYSSTASDLRSYFEQFGEVHVCEVKKDANGRSRGFGFVRFKDVEVQKNVMSLVHEIDGRRCEVKLPNSKIEPGNSAARKIFIGQVPAEMTSEDLENHFKKFGDITDVYIPQPHRHFGFVTFEDSDVSQSLYGTEQVVDGHTLTVNPAAPKNTGTSSGRGRKELNDEQPSSRQMPSSFRGMGGAPGGFGGYGSYGAFGPGAGGMGMNEAMLQQGGYFGGQGRGFNPMMGNMGMGAAGWNPMSAGPGGYQPGFGMGMGGGMGGHQGKSGNGIKKERKSYARGSPEQDGSPQSMFTNSGFSGSYNPYGGSWGPR